MGFDPHIVTRLQSVVVFETHPGVRAGLVRRLEAEPGVVVIQALSDPGLFDEAVELFSPAFAVVGMFGPYGSHAANRAAGKGTRTKVLAVVPAGFSDRASDLDEHVIVVEDTPRGDSVARLVAEAKQSA